MVGHRAAVDDRADHLGVSLGIYAQPDQAVVDQNHAADAHIHRQILISDRSPLAVAHHFFCRQCESLPLLEHHFTFLKIAQADLRSLGIQKGSYRHAQLAAKAHDPAELGLVLFMCPV